MTTHFAGARKDRAIQEHVHDPYFKRRKPPEPSVCPVCHAVFKNGRWQWLNSWRMNANEEICQACCRIRDNYPAGLITLSGEFVRTHKAQALNLVRNLEKLERALHPLHRIIKIEEHRGDVIVSTTDIHLPKRIGEALHHACKGH